MPIRQAARVEDSFAGFRSRVDTRRRQLVFAGNGHNALDYLRAIGRSNRDGLAKKTCGAGALARGICFFRRWHRQQIGVGGLHSRKILRSRDCPLQTLAVKLIGGGARRPAGEIRANRNDGVLFLNVLMNGVVGEASQGKTGAGEDGFDLVGRREATNSVEDVRGFFFGQH